MNKVAFIFFCFLKLPAFAATDSIITEDQDRIVVEITGAPSDDRTTDVSSQAAASTPAQEDTSFIDSEIARLNAEQLQIRQQAYEGEPAEDARQRRIRMSELAGEVKELLSHRPVPAGQ